MEKLYNSKFDFMKSAIELRWLVCFRLDKT